MSKKGRKSRQVKLSVVKARLLLTTLWEAIDSQESFNIEDLSDLADEINEYFPEINYDKEVKGKNQGCLMGGGGLW